MHHVLTNRLQGLQTTREQRGNRDKGHAEGEGEKGEEEGGGPTTHLDPISQLGTGMP